MVELDFNVFVFVYDWVLVWNVLDVDVVVVYFYEDVLFMLFFVV